jgi:uncharacterized membrane protein YkgB
MSRITNFIEASDQRLTRWMADHGVVLLRLSLGIVYLWFGALKLMPNLSPAESLAARSIYQLSGGALPASLSVPLLAAWECLIGIGLLSGLFLRTTLLLLGVQMIGTLSPVFLFPQEVFARFPYALTLEGQYIVKNLVLISAAVVIGATVRGGKVIAEPDLAEAAKQEEAARAEQPVQDSLSREEDQGE